MGTTTLKDKVVELCSERGITVRELERRAGLKARTIQHWDESEPSGKKIYAVAKVLGVPVDDLMSVYFDDLAEEMEQRMRDAFEQSLRETLDREWPTDEEVALVNMFQELNSDGQELVASFMQTLRGNPKYSKNNADTGSVSA